MKVRRNIRVVSLELPDIMLDGRDLVFNVGGIDGSKMGTLKVSQGGLDWKSRGQQWCKTIPWPVFDTIMRDYYNQKRYTPKSL